MPDIKAVVFDLGGTLLHYYDQQSPQQAEHHFRRVTKAGAQAVYTSLLKMGQNLRVEVPLESILDKHVTDLIGRMRADMSSGSVETALRAALIELGAKIDDSLWAEVRGYFYTEIDQIVFPRDGLVETLNRLEESGYQLAIISNTMWAADLHDKHLERFGVLDRFPLRVYSCDESHVKPHPSIFKSTMKKLGVEASQAVYIGDTPEPDIIGSQGVGMRGILIRSPYMPVDESSIKPDGILDELPDLIGVLEGFSDG